MAANNSPTNSTRSNSPETLTMDTEVVQAENSEMAAASLGEMSQTTKETPTATEGATGIDKLLQQQKNEIMYELRRLKMGDRPVTGQGHKETVENFFDRVLLDQSGQPPEPSDQHRPEAVTVEVNALVERRPVSSLLQTARFRSNLEAALRHAISNVSPASSSSNVNSGTAQRPAAPPAPTNLDLPAPQRESRVPEPRSQPASYSRQQFLDQIRQHAGPQDTSPPQARRRTTTPPTPRPRVATLPQPSPRAARPPVVTAEPIVQPAPALIESWVQNELPVEVDNSAPRDHGVEASLEETLHEDFIAEISDLVQRQLVTSSLAGHFRDNLEQLMTTRIRDMVANGVREQHPLSGVPRTQVPRNDFSHLGIHAGAQGSDILDDVSVISATAAVTMPQNYASSRDLASIRSELQELRSMMRLSFDLQLDIQRAIRQEVAAAVSGALANHPVQPPPRTQPVTAATPASSRPISESRCLICIDQSVDSVLYQCGHMCVCYRCGLDLRSRNAHCPVCRASIKDIIRAYRSNTDEDL